MPRVRAPPVAASPVKIPLNDDREEKAKRLQSRQALHEMHLNSLKAAASPARKRKSLGPDAAAEDALRTPHKDGQDEAYHVGGTAATPMKRVPILANFEEWMRMATDNKINAANSWNFALIDYFHDMSLLREGDGVNFQKASCTLDGCVKIYTSRVDSVATETGKLLSGLADSGNKKQQSGREGDEDDEDQDEDGEGGTKTKTKKKTRSAEATLATSFAQLQLKKMELDFAVDPLFKKTSADFDEGGAKGLLLNHLCIDNTGRIVFDSSDDVQPEAAEDSERPEETKEPASQIDIGGLASRFFPDLSKLDEQEICPSMKTFELGSGESSIDLPFLKAASDDWRKQKEEEQHQDDDARSGIVLDDDNAMGFDDDDALGGFDLPPETGFGEGGEVWAREAHLEPHMAPVDVADGAEDAAEGEVMGFRPDGDRFAVTLTHRADNHENILSYFDQALQKNWAGPEHWKIKKIKDAKAATATAPAKRKEKEAFEIDFASAMSPDMAALLYTPAASNAVISLPKTQWRSKTRNLLPDDRHFHSRNLLRLFLKPKARIGTRGRNEAPSAAKRIDENAHVDEAYWAQHGAGAAAREEPGVRPDYDANFFQDDALGGGAGDDMDDFPDAPEMLPPEGVDAVAGAGQTVDDALSSQGPSSSLPTFGSQLVTQSRRLRPEYVQYARVAKKVDVRRLKEEMWKGIGFEQFAQKSDATNVEHSSVADPEPAKSEETLRFTDVIKNLQHVYPQQQMADISTSYCFICLLHLANEKGLVIDNHENFEELSIRRDTSAEIVVGE